MDKANTLMILQLKGFECKLGLLCSVFMPSSVLFCFPKQVLTLFSLIPHPKVSMLSIVLVLHKQKTHLPFL